MSLTRERKETVVAEVKEAASNAQAAVAAEYIGLNVLQMTELRAKAREAGVKVRVIKNSLAHRAVEGTAFECLQSVLSGPLLLVFSDEDPGAGARLVRDFSKDNNQLVTKAVSIGGELRPAEDLQLLANIPTLDEARAQLLGVFKAPQTQLVRVLGEPASQFVRALSARNESQQTT